LELGINDAIRRIAPSRIRNNIKSIIEKVKTKYPNVKIALMGMQLPTFIPGAAIQEFRNLYQQLATEYQLTFVPFLLAGVAGKRHLNLRDGLHPSAEGYQVIAENVWPIIKSLIANT
jgi:acyl-CoA thioesterase-1